MKVAIVGSGYFSQFHFDAWARCPEVELVGLASFDRDTAQQMGAKYQMPVFENAAAMCAQIKPELLDIITPPASHAGLIQMASDAGINVVCQKPFCGTLEQARAASDCADKANIDLIVHENFRFQPWYREIARQLQAGRLGKVYQIAFRLRPGDGQGPNAYLARQPYFQKMQRFLVHETAIHYVDVFRYLLGEASSVWADLSRLNPVIAGEDRCLLVMDHGEGKRAVLDGNRLSDHKAQNSRLTMGEMTVEGELGCIFLSGDGDLYFRAHGEQEALSIDYAFEDRGFGGDCVYHFTRHVVDHYVNGTALENTARDYLRNLEIEEAIYLGAEDGQRVRLD